MKPRLCPLLGASLSFLAAAAVAATMPPAPDTPKGDAADVIQGVRSPIPTAGSRTGTMPRSRPGATPRTTARAPTSTPCPAAQAVADELTRLITATSPGLRRPAGARRRACSRSITTRPSSSPAGRAERQRRSRQPAATCSIPTPSMPAATPRSTGTSPRPTARKVAVSLSLNGSEDGTLHVYDVATGKEIEAPIPRVQYPTAGGSAGLDRRQQGRSGTRAIPAPTRPRAERHFYQQAYFHRLGSDAASRPAGARRQGRRAAHRARSSSTTAPAAGGPGERAARRRRRVAALGAEAPAAQAMQVAQIRRP